MKRFVMLLIGCLISDYALGQSDKLVRKIDYTAQVTIDENPKIKLTSNIQLHQKTEGLKGKWFRSISQSGPFELLPEVSQEARSQVPPDKESNKAYIQAYLDKLERSRMPEHMKERRRESLLKRLNGEPVSRNSKRTYRATTNGVQIPTFCADGIDHTPSEFNLNYLYYKMVLYHEDRAVYTGSVLKIPVIKAPVIDGENWSWSPIKPDGEPVKGLLTIGESLTKGVCYLEPLDKPLTGTLDCDPSAASLSLKFSLNGEERKQINDLESLNQRLNYSYQNAGMRRRRLSDRAGSITLNELSLGSSERNVTLRSSTMQSKLKVSSVINVKTGRKVEFSLSQINCSARVLSGSKYRFSGSLYDQATDKMHSFRMDHYSIPEFDCRLQSTAQGIVIDWAQFLKQCDLSAFAVKPGVKLTRSMHLRKEGTGSVTYTRGLDVVVPLDKKLFVDNLPDLTPGELYSYSIQLVGGIVKSQKFIVGRGVVDCYTKYRGDFANKQITPRYRGAEKTSDTQVVLTEEQLENPLKIGIWKPEMFYRNTGELGNELYIRTIKSLEKDTTLKLFDREHTADILKELELIIPPEKMTIYSKEPVDFVIRVCDFSHAKGNGVELWLTRVDLKDDDPNYNNSWRIARIDAGKKVDFAAIHKKLLAKIKGLAGMTPTPKAKKTERPINFVFDFLRPVEQKSQVDEYREITETLVLETSNKLSQQNLYSRSDWNLILQERLAMDRQGLTPFEDIQGDVLITGKVWKNSKFRYYFKAIDMRNGELVSSYYTSGTQSQVAAKMAKWLGSIKLSKHTACGVDEREMWDIHNYEMSLHPFRGESDWVGFAYLDYDSLKPLKSYSTSSNIEGLQGKLTFADKLYNIGSRQRAIEYLKKEWVQSGEQKFADKIAYYYQKMGLYILEADLYDQVIKKHGKNAVNPARLSKARSLAKKRGNVIKSFSRKTTSGSRSVVDRLKNEIAAREDQEKIFKEQFYITRPRGGFEWGSYDAVTLDRWTVSVDTMDEFFEMAKHLKGVPGRYRVSYGPASNLDRKTPRVEYVKGEILFRYPRPVEALIKEYGIEHMANQPRSDEFVCQLFEYKKGALFDSIMDLTKDDENRFVENVAEGLNTERGYVKLSSLLQVDFFSSRGNSGAKKLVKRIMSMPLPDYYSDWSQTSHMRQNLIFFKILKGDNGSWRI